MNGKSFSKHYRETRHEGAKIYCLSLIIFSDENGTGHCDHITPVTGTENNTVHNLRST